MKKYYLVSSTKEAICTGDEKLDILMDFCAKIDNDHSGANIRELNPNDPEDASLIKCEEEQ